MKRKFIEGLAKELKVKISEEAEEVFMDALAEIAVEIALIACSKAAKRKRKSVGLVEMKEAIAEFYREG
ncbi:MAG: hypothetical protein QW507_02345 [Candidatus Nanoarchaeia archaeon]|nr:hypothetical protein [Candidatus Haiyanarchaeum thermophilum]MCW1303259.1 hypothetical protein [Candidatus Haiyanarchaeum thermophilum]MCW1304009.1 hypothetical protein [Candidatus Haiyanarchaeum thermophilum]MCW1306419.1 hypothetical protein [Candidatus Haiyanarchaeum thermophilum]MCW1307283.1 hypothetical protein [Candidatus Haiyanarchaeum thermophilum]